MTSTDIGPGTKNIPRLAAVFCHCAPQLAIKCCRKQLLTQQGADALEDAPSKSGGFFLEGEARKYSDIGAFNSFHLSTYLSVL